MSKEQHAVIIGIEAIITILGIAVSFMLLIWSGEDASVLPLKIAGTAAIIFFVHALFYNFAYDDKDAPGSP